MSFLWVLLQNGTLIFLITGFLLTEKHLISIQRSSASMKKYQAPWSVCVCGIAPDERTLL